MTEEEKILEEYKKEFENKIVDVIPFEVNGTTYDKFEMRYPTYSEVSIHSDALLDGDDSESSKKRRAAMFELVKLCTTNIKKPSDLMAFPSYATFKLMLWMGKHIA